MVTRQVLSLQSCYVDGPNVDGVLSHVLGRQPTSQDRPRWDRVLDNLRNLHAFEGRPVFVMNRGYFSDKVLPFYRCLKTIGYEVILAGSADRHSTNDDPVDEYILDQLHDFVRVAETGQPVSIALISHDHVYAEPLESILRLGGRVTLIGFREWLASGLLAIAHRGAEILDLEAHLQAFSKPLGAERPYSPLDLL